VKSDDAANDTMVDSNMTTESKTAQSSTSSNTAGSGFIISGSDFPDSLSRDYKDGIRVKLRECEANLFWGI